MFGQAGTREKEQRSRGQSGPALLEGWCKQFQKKKGGGSLICQDYPAQAGGQTSALLAEVLQDATPASTRVYLRGGGLGVASKQIVYPYHRVWPEALRSRVKHLFPRGSIVALCQDRQLSLRKSFKASIATGHVTLQQNIRNIAILETGHPERGATSAYV